MAHSFFEILRAFFQHHGYWAVAAALLLENAGVPVPGESVLLLASFLAFSERHLRLVWIIAVGTLACTLGDNAGYAIGWKGGRPLLERWKRFFHVEPSHIERGERLFAKYGPIAIFFARFIFGLRIVAGPLAGVLHMPWSEFAVFNFLGAALWVTVISSLGYLFGQHWQALAHGLRDADFALLAVAALVALFLWRRKRMQKIGVRSPEPGRE